MGWQLIKQIGARLGRGGTPAHAGYIFSRRDRVDILPPQCLCVMKHLLENKQHIGLAPIRNKWGEEATHVLHNFTTTFHNT